MKTFLLLVITFALATGITFFPFVTSSVIVFIISSPLIVIGLMISWVIWLFVIKHPLFIKADNLQNNSVDGLTPKKRTSNGWESRNNSLNKTI